MAGGSYLSSGLQSVDFVNILNTLNPLWIQGIDKPLEGYGEEAFLFSISFGDMRVKAPFFGNKRLRLWRKMNTCLSGNSFLPERISAFPFSLKNQGFSTN